jgi:hypothetical protein
MWQPIDTAPKDGSEFLAYDTRTRKMDVCYSYVFNANSQLWFVRAVQSDSEYGPDPEDFGYDSDDITHWRPLPDPPEVA